MSADVISETAVLPLPRSNAFLAAQNHSKRVRVMKLALPIAALAMAGAFVFSAYRASSSDVVMSTARSAVEKNQLVMADPKLEGFGKDGRPFTVDATRAVQAMGNENIINLDAINARLPTEEGWITVSAPGGVYDRVRNVLDISGDAPNAIKVVSSDKSTASMRSAVIDMETGTLRATDSVDLKQQDGNVISAEQLDVSKGGDVIVFKNKVRMTLGAEGQKSGESNAKP